MKPVIGITVNEDNHNNTLFLAYFYHEVVEQAGGIPLLLPPTEDKVNIKQMVSLIDGLILAGGVDVDPFFMGQEPSINLGVITPKRDCFELELVQNVFNKDLPILAICRGVQLLNIAAGGTIYQDIFTKIDSPLKHRQDAPKWYPTHKIEIKSGSMLESITENKEIRVNSFHHQAIDKIAPGFIATAYSADGIIEAIESQRHKFVIGVQWHPECMWKKDVNAYRIFEKFVSSAKME